MQHKQFTGMLYHSSQQTAVSAGTWELGVLGWGEEHPELAQKGTRTDMDLDLQRAKALQRITAPARNQQLLHYSVFLNVIVTLPM